MRREELLDLCKLARLSLDEGEIGVFETKFNSMLSFVQQVLDYEPQSGAGPLTLIDTLELRRDIPQSYDWPPGTLHDYRVPQIINFGSGGED